MTEDEIDEVLRRTLDDLRMSRGERKVLRALFAEHDQQVRHAPSLWRKRAFEVARDVMAAQNNTHDRDAVWNWLEAFTKLLINQPGDDSQQANVAEVIFSPGKACRTRIAGLLGGAKKSADICVFTITDNRLAEPILLAHRRGVRVRIVTDNDKSHDAGSDVEKLAEQGVPVRVDHSDHHMHHKYAVFDDATVLTGSYNWTRSAAEFNRENVVVSSDPRLVGPFAKSFESLWKALGS